MCFDCLSIRFFQYTLRWFVKPVQSIEGKKITRDRLKVNLPLERGEGSSRQDPNNSLYLRAHAFLFQIPAQLSHVACL